MKLPPRVNGPAAALAAALICSGAAGATSAEKPASSSDSAAIFPGTNSKEPISIDADKLVYYDKEHKAIYSGSVVVIQGDTKMTCTVMTVFLDRSPAQGQSQAAAPAQGEPSADGTSQAAAKADEPSQGRPIRPHGRLGRQTSRRDRAGHRHLQDAGRHWRQRQL